MTLRSRSTVAGLALSILAGACATGGMNARSENIPALEQRAAARPGDVESATKLGIAYYNAKRYDDARRVLGPLVGAADKSGTASLYLGLANEELKDWAGARKAYETYIAAGPSGDAKEQIRGRVALVGRQQLKQEAKQVLEREQQLSEEPPTPRTVAVLPFQMVGTSEELSPLQTALSDMIITDLSVSPSLTSVERVKINSMIDEMLLAQAGLAESTTGARVGRLLKAEHVVQGVLAQSGDKQLRLDATVLNTVRRTADGTFGQSQQVDAIFDLEKQIVFSVFNSVGVTLTAAEREKVNENRTGSLLAFLAYGRGLESMDRGNFQQAQTFFRQASQLDPSFTRAQVQQGEAANLQQAEQSSTGDVAQGAAGGVTATSETASLLNNIVNEVAPSPVTQTTQTQSTETPATTQTQNQTGNLATSTGQTGGISQATKATVTITIPNPTKTVISNTARK